MATIDGQDSQRSPGQRGGLGWKHGNPGHRRRASGPDAGLPGRVSRRKGPLGRPSLVQGLSVADLTPDSSRMPPESPFSPERAGRYQGNGGGLGWKHGNAGHHRRAGPTPATFTRSGAGHQDGGGNRGHHRRARFPAFTRATRRVGLETRQPWPPETGIRAGCWLAWACFTAKRAARPSESGSGPLRG